MQFLVGALLETLASNLHARYRFRVTEQRAGTWLAILTEFGSPESF
jgi:hypothetical protein